MADSLAHKPERVAYVFLTNYTMGVQVITSYDQFKQVTGGSKVVVIDFWATWCGPCKMIGPVFEKISDTPAGDKIGFYKVDVDEQSQIAQEVGIRAMPTFVFFKDGQKIDTIVGADPAKLQAAITQHSA
ncbi:hypothetical protein MCAP1_000277 [Malassezia caprae]|uniref:Thioredoxin n=1 Tax=Malassezia caprae TaxID=1381934 RepID=A0AAF0E340_9BASI|nr:hypothetical protein MCAP1_000277 [Malassezia caprae]